MRIGNMYRDGSWVPALSGATREVYDPADQSVIGIVAEGDAADVDLAVAAARTAFDQGPWPRMAATERAAVLLRAADLLEARLDEFALIDTLDSGKPLRDSAGDASDAVGCLRYYAGLVDKPLGQVYNVPDPDTQSFVVREPLGVCAQIIPWNYPLMMAVWKLAPCLAAGNASVIKPSVNTPLSIIRFFELLEEAGLPAGVANLVLGPGSTVGQALVEHPGVDKVAFTGGGASGRKIMQAAAGTFKNISLELGGKSPCIVFDDVDIDVAVDWTLFAIFCNQGEVCSAGSRLLLQRGIHDDFVQRLAAHAQRIRIARGTEEGAEMGPLVSPEHMQRVLDYIELGKQEGAKLLCGGNRLTSGEFAKGNFVAPTVFDHCTSEMRIVQEEIFGPVLTVQVFDTEEQAIALANDTRFGLAAGVFCRDVSRAFRVIKAVRAGITWINAYHPTFNQAPWGGYKESGIGRELGTFGLEEYTEVKQINVNLADGPVGWFGN
ncbi:MAG: aldehyde dehydrogenase family protein [Coriobacteriales bacterium]|nr:aldehyde dehydrogenase family protein [Coriobacteriales bacterium]